MPRALPTSALALLCACAARDPYAYLRTEQGFLQAGVDLEREEGEVRHVLAQRGLSVVARLATPWFVALGAQTGDARASAVRVISPRGVVVADDAVLDDLFAPARVELNQSFGGSWGEYVFVADARVAPGRDLGCVTLTRLLPDGSAVAAQLDLGPLGSRACVAKLAPGRGGRLHATVAWPGLHAIRTPELEVELALVEPLIGQPAPLVPVVKLADPNDWLEAERARLAALPLVRAPFSERHAAGVARAALAQLAGQDSTAQRAAYRGAVGHVLPTSPEAEVVADTLAHLERGWLDLEAERALAESDSAEMPSSPSESSVDARAGAGNGVKDGLPAPETAPETDQTVIEPEVEGRAGAREPNDPEHLRASAPEQPAESE